MMKFYSAVRSTISIYDITVLKVERHWYLRAMLANVYKRRNVDKKHVCFTDCHFTAGNMFPAIQKKYIFLHLGSHKFDPICLRRSMIDEKHCKALNRLKFRNNLLFGKWMMQKHLIPSFSSYFGKRLRPRVQSWVWLINVWCVQRVG